MPGRWTPATVKARLAVAVRLIERNTTRPGPRAPRSCWPAVSADALDRWWQAQAPDDLAARRNRVMVGASAEEIAEADEALGWLPLVRHEQHREGIFLWLRAEAHDVSFRDAARQAGVAYRTIIRHRDDAVAAIVDSLNKTQNRVK